MFPIDLSRTNLSIKDISEKLKEDYYFKMILNDYFVQKPRLPIDTKRIVTKTSYIYPIESKEEAQKFIEEIKTKYSYNIPLLPNIMTVNPTEKPDLPWDYREIQEHNLTIPITSKKALVETARMLRADYYFWRIPETWIDIQEDRQTMEMEEQERPRPALPESLEETKRYMEELKVHGEIIELPITNQREIRESIAQLHKIFIFNKAPDFLFNLPPLPEATWDVIPEKLFLQQ